MLTKYLVLLASKGVGISPRLSIEVFLNEFSSKSEKNINVYRDRFEVSN